MVHSASLFLQEVIDFHTMKKFLALKPILNFFFVIGILLLPIVSANAEQLFEQNLLQSSTNPEPGKPPQLLAPVSNWGDAFARASEKARDGKLIESLNDLSKLIANHPEEVDLSKAFAERAEVKSLLGFTNSSLEDCDQACLRAGSGRFLHLWHRWLILERAGRLIESERALQAADKEAHKQLTPEPSHYISSIKNLAAQHRTTALKPDEHASKKLLTVIKELSARETPPNVDEVRVLYDIPLEGSPNSSFTCSDCSGNKFWIDASASSDMTILHLRVNTDFCALSKAEVWNQFELESEQNGTSFSARTKGKLQGLRFAFDSDRVRFIGFYWKTPGLPCVESSISESEKSK